MEISEIKKETEKTAKNSERKKEIAKTTKNSGTKKEIKPTQLIRKSTRLIILYLTPVGKYPMILHDRSFLYAFIPSLSSLT